MQRNLRLFYRAFLVCACIGFLIDLLYNGFQVVVTDVISDFVMGLLLAAITVYICGEAEREMETDDAMKFLQVNSVDVIENEGTVIGTLDKYKQFYMGNLQYDKNRKVIIGSKIIVNRN